ncbi:MAG: hypothetical protein NW237_04295 [Cyanobacteriota bacterium]|nr:hypothetical protein [Cyanobacteriota bacterium]
MYISEEHLPPDLHQLVIDIKQARNQRQGDCLSLLQLLRLLEDLHRSILEEEFQAALPSTRQDLHRFLLDLEEAGNWPYIPRTHLRTLIQRLVMSESRSPAADSER